MTTHSTLHAFPGLHLTTCPEGSRPKEGAGETWGRPGPVSQVSGFSLTARTPITAHRPRRKHRGGIQVTTGGGGRGGGGGRYLPVPQAPDRRAGRSTTLPSISSGAKQAFIAALAARLRRRAAQRIPKTEGNCSPPARSPGLGTRRRTLFPRSTAGALGAVRVLFHRAPSAAPSLPVLRRPGLQSSLKPRAPAGGGEGGREPRGVR